MEQAQGFRATLGCWHQVLRQFWVEGRKLAKRVHQPGAPDSQVLPSHLAAQGFFLLRARAQMYELMDILTK